MKHAVLRRTETSDEGTFGHLEVEGRSFHTGELPWRDNAQGRSCIPAGEYVCHWQNSPKFGWCFEITHVPDRSRVLIHAGNLCGDVDLGFETDVEGCTLLGLKRTEINGQRAVGGSKDAMKQFHALMGTEDFKLTVVDEYLEAGDAGGNVA